MFGEQSLESGSIKNRLFVGKLARELWARENRQLRTSDSMGFLGRLCAEGILGKPCLYSVELVRSVRIEARVQSTSRKGDLTRFVGFPSVTSTLSNVR